MQLQFTISIWVQILPYTDLQVLEPNTLFRKNYVGLIFSSQIEEYVGARATFLSTQKNKKK